MFLATGVFVTAVVLCMSRLAVHTQQRLVRFNERDEVIDALVWITPHTSRRRR